MLGELKNQFGRPKKKDRQNFYNFFENPSPLEKFLDSRMTITVLKKAFKILRTIHVNNPPLPRGTKFEYLNMQKLFLKLGKDRGNWSEQELVRISPELYGAIYFSKFAPKIFPQKSSLCLFYLIKNNAKYRVNWWENKSFSQPDSLRNFLKTFEICVQQRFWFFSSENTFCCQPKIYSIK